VENSSVERVDPNALFSACTSQGVTVNTLLLFQLSPVARSIRSGVYANMAHSKDKPANGVWFSRLAKSTAKHAGRPGTFSLAVIIIGLWAVTGPMFNYSDTWQLVINTGTTIVTFLMVFLIQNTQNRDSQALHVKLDELIRAIKGARNCMIDLDNLTDEELERIQNQYTKIARQSKHDLPSKRAEAGAVAVAEKKSNGP
jgi:low affinity Fe/Cu permease